MGHGENLGFDLEGGRSLGTGENLTRVLTAPSGGCLGEDRRGEGWRLG